MIVLRSLPARTVGVTARRIAMLCLAGLLTACASDKPAGYGLAPNGPVRTDIAPAAALGDKTQPDTPGMYRSLIERMQAQGLFFASLAHIAQFENQFGISPESILLRARAQRETGQLDQSAEAYRGLLDTPLAAPAWHGLGLIAGARSDYAGAAKALAEAARRAPTDPMVLNDYGYALLRAGQLSAARLPFAQAAELDAGNTKIIANLAVYLRVNGEIGRADAVMERGALPPATRAAVLRLSERIRADIVAHKPDDSLAAQTSDRASTATVTAATTATSNGPVVSRVDADTSAMLVSRHSPIVAAGMDSPLVSARPSPSSPERVGTEPR
ncbi:pilus assembly protein [Pigmentiphaga aceris]|uniref:Pilus assembly protein n=1 Tax=Pigmentiphaga aceris TaxID=1940612 RepID=A0A5C0ATL2_9BURK|nr:pilus assembly protein [Pigmentiphaga aceris]QEI05648.1 pilus assembly protein [Pigmentiphaga aceris]